MKSALSERNVRYRPCLIDIRTKCANSGDIKEERYRAIFHCWAEDGWSMGDIRKSELVGIVEYEDGTVHKHFMNQIRFVDNMVSKIFDSKEIETKYKIFQPEVQKLRELIEILLKQQRGKESQ